MKDDFDNGLGIPDDELTGGSAISDLSDVAGSGPEGDLLGDLSQPAGRPSGGARARRSPSAPRAASSARKPVKNKPAKKTGPKKVAKKAAKKKSAGKAKPACKSARKRARSGKKK